MIPDAVLQIVAAAFPGEPVTDLAPTFGGFSNRTVAARIGEARVVIKAASSPPKRADVRREARVLSLLRGSALPAPELLALGEDGEWTVAVTRALAGEPGLRLYERPPESLAGSFAALGAALARVHTVRCAANIEPDLDLAARAAETRAALAGLPLDQELRETLVASLDHPAWRGEARLVHGDAGLHNTLWQAGALALLDWEWAGWGNPLVDLAWVAWTMHFRQVQQAAWEAFLDGYGASRALALGLEPQTVRALALGQIAGILTRARLQPPAWEEWLRRLRWTVALPDGAWELARGL